MNLSSKSKLGDGLQVETTNIRLSRLASGGLIMQFFLSAILVITPSENSKKHQASKNSYGLNNPFGKLSDEEIHKIFQYALKDNLRPIEIAEKMHLNRSTVVKTLSGKLHKNIFDQYDMSKYNMKYGSRGKYSNDIRSQMISLYNDGYKFSEIQKILNLPDSSYNAIRKIIKQSKSKKI